jgi:hypothetical protein
MWTTKLKACAALLAAMGMVTGAGILARETAPGPKSPVSAGGKAESANSAAMRQTEAKLAELQELIRPQPGEHVTNMARIAWQRDPWVAAVKAGKEGKPVLVYAEGAAGVACGYG